MHGQTLKRFEAHKGSNWSIPIIISICLLDFHKAIMFSRFPLLDCWHARHLQKPLCMMQAWEKKHRASQPKSSLGAPKNGAFAALERQKCLRCGAENDHAVPRWIEAPALSTTKIPIFVGQTIYCSMPRWGKARSGSRFACMICSVSWLSVLHGSRACEGGPKPADI